MSRDVRGWDDRGADCRRARHCDREGPGPASRDARPAGAGPSAGSPVVRRRDPGVPGEVSRDVRGRDDRGAERQKVRRRCRANPGAANRGQDDPARGKSGPGRRGAPAAVSPGVHHYGRDALAAGSRRGRRPGRASPAAGNPGVRHCGSTGRARARAGRRRAPEAPGAVSRAAGQEAGPAHRSGRRAGVRDRPKDPAGGLARARNLVPERNFGGIRGGRQGRGPSRGGTRGTGRPGVCSGRRAGSPEGWGCRGRHGRGSAERRYRTRGTRRGGNPGGGRSSGHHPRDAHRQDHPDADRPTAGHRDAGHPDPGARHRVVPGRVVRGRVVPGRGE